MSSPVEMFKTGVKFPVARMIFYESDVFITVSFRGNDRRASPGRISVDP